jgi:hypothetical protein
MLRRVAAILAAVTALSLVGIPAAQAGGPTVSVGPVTINGNPGCC